MNGELKVSDAAPSKGEEAAVMSDIDMQIRANWALYYKAIGAGRVDEAKRIFDRVTALAFAQTSRKSTKRILAAVQVGK